MGKAQDLLDKKKWIISSVSVDDWKINMKDVIEVFAVMRQSFPKCRDCVYRNYAIRCFEANVYGKHDGCPKDNWAKGWLF